MALSLSRCCSLKEIWLLFVKYPGMDWCSNLKELFFGSVSTDRKRWRLLQHSFFPFFNRLINLLQSSVLTLFAGAIKTIGNA